MRHVVTIADTPEFNITIMCYVTGKDETTPMKKMSTIITRCAYCPQKLRIKYVKGKIEVDEI